MKPRLPDAPPALNDEGRRLWADVLDQFELEDSPDALKVLESACVCWQLFRQAEQEIAKNGLFQKGRYGQTIPNCACDVARRFHAQFLASMKLLKLESIAEEAARVRGPGRPGRKGTGR